MGEPPGRQRFPPHAQDRKTPAKVMGTHRGVCGHPFGQGGWLQGTEGLGIGRNQGSLKARARSPPTTFWLVGPRHKGFAGMCGPRVARVSEALQFSTSQQASSGQKKVLVNTV